MKAEMRNLISLGIMSFDVAFDLVMEVFGLGHET